MSGLAGRIAALPPEKRRLLELRLKKEGLEAHRETAGPAPAAAPIPPRDPAHPGPFPLTFGQQRLWFIEQLNPGNRAYNVPFAGRLRGPLDAGLLERSLLAVVRRHEGLRSRFPAVDGRPVQIVDPEPLLHLPVVDVSALPPARREAEASRLLREEPRTPFDLARGPVLRVTLVRLSRDEHELLVTMAHIVTDAWSMAIFFRELPAIYDALRRGRPVPLPPLPVQVADYALWQREHLDDEALEREIAFWRRHLEGVPKVLELPVDKPRPPVQSLRGRRSRLDFPRSLAREVRALGERLGATPFMVLLAAFDVLIHRYSGAERFVVASPVVVRQPEVYGLIGFFINTVVLRADLDGDPTFAELQARVRDSALATYAHQDLPFEKLVDALDLPRDPSRPALAQVNFLLQNVHIPPPDFEGIALVSSQQTDTLSARFDLSLGLFEEGEDLNGSIEYCTDLFEHTTAARMTAHLRRLLDVVVAEPGLRISALPMLSAAERHQLAAECNDTGAVYPAESTVAELFEQVAAAHAGSPALLLAEPDGAVREISYADLDRRANRLADYLVSLGVGPETPVATFLERSPELIVALLAVLKAGAFYVPFDPAHPPERLALQLEETWPPVILTAGGELPVSPPFGTLVVDLEADAPAIASSSDQSPRVRVGPEALAYVMYTSGSTGRPKGIGVPHRGVVRLVRGGGYAGFGPDEVFLALAPPTFDASTFEIWGALLHGARLALFPPGPLSMETLAAALERYGVTTLWLTAGLFHLAVDERPAALRGLRQLLAGGDALSAEHVARALAELPGVRLVNGYGPTEGTTFTCCARLTEPPPPGAPVPIGRPIADTQVHLLDRSLGPVPIGVHGELCAGGAGLARGYFGRPDFTAERFVPDPCGAPGSRLYRTGDLVRRLPDGSIEFLGRLDRQVKVRGFRVEPVEIEQALARHGAVRETAVELRDGRLVAFVVPEDGEAPAAEDLRSFLAAQLPDFMIPGAFVPLEKLPLTPNGKVDRAALAGIAATPAPSAGAGEAASPRTAAEATLVKIWKEILERDEVGVHDGFFELGGDSILCIQLVARAAEAGIFFEPGQVFEHPTIAGLAAVAAEAPRTDAEQGPITGAAPLTPIQRWFFEMDPPVPHHWNMAVLLEVERPLDARLLAEALAHLLAHHDMLRARFLRTAVGWRQEVAPPAPAGGAAAPLTLIDLSSLPAAGALRALEAAAPPFQASLDLVSGPLLRAALFRLSGRGRAAGGAQTRPSGSDSCAPSSLDPAAALGRPGSDRLLFAAHHLVVDGVSWRILLADLQTVYSQLEAGGPVALPAKTTSYRSWAERLKAWARTAELRQELGLWRSLKAAERAGALAPPPPEISGPPPDPDRPGASDRVEVSLGAADTRALLHDVPAVHPARLEEVLLAALARALGRTVLMTLEGHGREPVFERIDLTRTVGLFTSLHPLLLEPKEGPGEALEAVRERLRSIPHRGLGYLVLRYLGAPEASEPLARLPQPWLSLNYLGRVDNLAGGDAQGASPLRVAAESPGPPQDPRNPRSHPLEITAFILSGELRMAWVFTPSPGGRAAVERLATQCMEEVRNLIAHCLSTEAEERRPAEFPHAQLGAQQLDKLLAKIGRGAGREARR